jgi:hypothetical protein
MNGDTQGLKQAFGKPCSDRAEEVARLFLRGINPWSRTVRRAMAKDAQSDH